MADGYVLATPVGQVRLLLNDVDQEKGFFFSNNELQAFLDMEGGSVKRAAAQAIDTNADSELLASKVLRTQDVSTDGATLADALRARAVLLRDQADEDEGGFVLVHSPMGCRRPPELTEWPVC